MWLTTLAIKRPLIVLIALGAVLAFGLFAWGRLGVELLPAMDAPIVSVTVAYPGAGPEAVDTQITQKIEDAVASLAEIDTIDSTSVEGRSSVSITFTEKASKDSTQEVERRVNAIRGDFPSEAKAPVVAKFDTSGPIVWISLAGDRDLTELQRVAEDSIKKELEATPGVARVELTGGSERE